MTLKIKFIGHKDLGDYIDSDKSTIMMMNNTIPATSDVLLLNHIFKVLAQHDEVLVVLKSNFLAVVDKIEVAIMGFEDMPDINYSVISRHDGDWDTTVYDPLQY